jgi:hypothetical protein
VSGAGTILLIVSETGGVWVFVVNLAVKPEDMNAFISPLEFAETYVAS